MFTGIIQTTGDVVLAPGRSGGPITVRPARPWTDLVLGESIAVNGACLTVTAFDGGLVTFDVVPETARVTNLGSIGPRNRVNLERSLRVGDRLGGHYVLGHVDCAGTARGRRTEGGETILEVAFPQQFERFLVTKGSVALNGVSLTLGTVRPDAFSVYLIPFTLSETNLGDLRPGDQVNIEFDYFGKWVLRTQPPASDELKRALERAGLIGEEPWNE